MYEKLCSLCIGYFFGCLLTAEAVARKYAGKSAGDLGETGNPGMANIMAALGFVPGILTLLGDLAKCIAAGLLSCTLFKDSGWIIVLYAGLGCTLGHDFPFWRKFRGGKGVAVTSMAIVMYAFWPGLAANIAGMLTVFAAKYLCLGGPVIPLVFMIILAAEGDREGAVIAAALTILAILAHGKAVKGIKDGKTGRTDVLKILSEKTRK